MELTRSLGISLAAGNDRGGIQRVLRDQDRGNADGPVQGQHTPVFRVALIETDGILLLSGNGLCNGKQLLREQETFGLAVKSAEDFCLLFFGGEFGESFILHGNLL